MHARSTIDEVAAQGRTLPHALYQVCDMLAELLVDLVINDEAFRASTILAHVLESTSHDKLRKLLGIRIIANDEGVFASKLQDHRGQSLGGVLHHLSAHTDTAHENDLVNFRDEGTACVGVSNCELHQVCWSTNGFKAAFDDLAVVLRGPRCVLRNLDDDSIPREESGNEWIEDIVERIVPRNNRTDDTHRNPFNPACLVHVHQT
mmetsp:Transcript_47094/g.134847  ORF Transcript_47094/g.134847 Transcript_47094/m.134847 type:complete len:205 (-) Transcript_47094:422-1036(-)